LKKTHKNKKGKKIISNVFDLKKYGEKGLENEMFYNVRRSP
jgi:hypothetical protein